MVWFYSILAGILCTVLISPMFWKRCISALRYKKKSAEYFNANPKLKKSKRELPENIQILDMAYKWEYDSLIGGIAAEVVFFIIGALTMFIYFFYAKQDIGFVSILSVVWVPVLFKIVFFLLRKSDPFSAYNLKNTDLISLVVIFFISVAINIVTPIYEFNNPKELAVSIIEPEIPIMSVDISKTLDVLEIADDTTISSPVYRNGEVIYVVKSEDLYTEAPGYISVKGDKVEFVERKLKYNPYIFGINNITLVARQSLPDKVFFGEFSLQKDAKGNIYYASLYGTHTFLRAGKNVEGMIYVNSSTGKVATCSLEEIPSFMSGISK